MLLVAQEDLEQWPRQLWETYTHHPGCQRVPVGWRPPSSAPGRPPPRPTVCRRAPPASWWAGPRWGRRSYRGCGGGINTTPVNGCFFGREEENPGEERGNTLGTKRLCAGGREVPIQHQRASSAPGLLQAAAAPQPAALPQVALVVQRLDLLRRQVEPAPPLFTLRAQRPRYWQKLLLSENRRKTLTQKRQDFVN